MRTISLLLVLGALVGCSGTQGGNPSLTSGKTPVSLILGSHSNAQVTALSLCLQTAQLLDTDGVTSVASVPGTGNTSVATTITPLGAPTALVNRSYGGVALQLSGACASGGNLRVANAHGQVAVTDNLILRFAGAFSVTQATGAIYLNPQAIVDQLSAASTSAQASLAAGSTAGQATSVDFWRPDLITSWQIQLTAPVDRTVDASVFVIDAFDNDAGVVTALHAQGRRAVCWLSVGTRENQRPDAASFPNSVLGSNVGGSANEKYVDIRQVAVLSPIMGARFDLCKAKGFDAVAIDNTDGYSNATGFPLTAQDQLTYNLHMAALAHARGLSIALQADIEQVSALSPSFDFGINQQCFQYGECNLLLSYLQAGKPVLQFETSLTTAQFCAQANALGFNSILKSGSLDASRSACR